MHVAESQLSGTPMDCSMPGFPVLHYLLESAQTHVHWVSDAIQPYGLFSCPLLLLPLIFPRRRVFSNESALLIKWPKYCSFNFSISPSSEYSGFISFRIDYSTGLSRVFSNTIAIYFHAYNIFKMTNFSNEGQIRGCQGLEVGVGVGCQTVTWGSLGYEMFNSLTVLVSWTWQSRTEQKSTKNLRNLNHTGGIC